MNTDPAETETPRHCSTRRNGACAPVQDIQAASPDALRFEDIFSLEDIQCIQDAFAEAADVASLITAPDGRPLTRPSNFTPFCRDIIRGTAKGRDACTCSDRQLGQPCRRGPTIERCRSAGLLDASTCIFFGERHIANWLVGQVIDESVDIESVLAFGREIGAEETPLREALSQVPRMSRERFTKVCQALYHFAAHLSAQALRTHEQALLINDLRHTQERLSIRDRNLADIIDFLPDPTLVVDDQGAVVFWNKAMEKLTGVAAEGMLGKAGFAYGTPFYGTPTPLLIDVARGAITRPDARYAVANADVGSIIAEVTVANLPGGVRHVWAKAVALRDATGRIIGGIETIRDVTDRHQADLALRESEEKFRRIVETAHEGVWVVDGEHKTTFVNRRMAAMLGYRPEELAGHPMEPFVSQEFRQRSRARLKKLRQGQSEVFEEKLLKKAGDTLWVMVSASPLYDPLGNYIGALGMYTDISGRKQIEEELSYHRRRLEAEVEERTRDLRLQALELAEANIRLSELDRLKSVFLSTVSHELRTPLTSILGFAKLIRRDFVEHFQALAGSNENLGAKGHRIANNLAVVYGEAERLTRLINDVLDLNRIESGNMFWRDSRFSPVLVLEKAARSIDGLLEQRPDVAFAFEADADVPDVCMDPDQLIQVVSNLLQNAVKFTQSGLVRMTVRREDTALRIAISDTGIGIPAGELESIFGKFHQVGRSDTLGETTRGTGLGLAICRQIVRHYGGRIWAESELGRGSTFFVHLPGYVAGSRDDDTETESARTPDAATYGQRP